MDHAQILMGAAANAHAAGKLSDAQHAEVVAFVGNLTSEQRQAIVTAAAFDWSGLLKILPALLTLIPGIGPFVGIITQLLPYILSLLNQNGGGTGPDPN